MTFRMDGATIRSPAEHRAIVAGCRAMDGASPSAAPRSSKLPRHGHMVRNLAGLRCWFDLQSSAGGWLVADNDNTPAELRGPGEQRQIEAERDIIRHPSRCWRLP